jgi:hypothetical protein
MVGKEKLTGSILDKTGLQALKRNPMIVRLVVIFKKRDFICFSGEKTSPPSEAGMFGLESHKPFSFC